MKRKTSLLIIYLTTSGLASGTVFAEDKPDSEVYETSLVPDVFEVTETAEPLVPVELISETVLNEIELGVGYVSDDAYKFGRYNGLQSEGPFAVGDIKIREFDEDGRFWSMRGTNLGLESRYLRLEGGLQGSHKFFLEYDELPNYKNNTVETPFLGVGTDNLTLPTGFDINTNINENLNFFELETKRRRAKVGAMFVPKEHWQFDIDYSHENKEGVDATGAAIANGRDRFVGNTTFSLIPEPIDYNTDLVNVTLRYDGDDGQIDLTYHMSLFDNNYDSLTWQNPLPSPSLIAPAPSAGSMSLAPDNEFHQLSLTGAYSLPYKSRLSGFLSMGVMTQNQEFLPYTVNPILVTQPLPVNSLNGEVWLTSAQLKLTSRPVHKLRLNAELRYNERDNQTAANTYTYVVLDSYAGRTVQNRPYDLKNGRIKLDANYRFNAITSLRGGYKYNEIKRDYANTERETTQENTLFAKWKIKAHSTVDLALFGEVSSRDGSEYDPLTNENTLMRKYNLADRERGKIGASIDYMATDRLFLSARADYNRDNYTDTQVGLTEAIQPVVTVDFSYQPRNNITTYGYYTYENIQSSQNGESLTTDWQADFDDTIDTAGIGAKLTGLGRWAIGADFVHSESVGEIKMTDLPGTSAVSQYPDNTTELNSVKLWTSYDYSKQLAYKLGYWFEAYRADNWAVDGLVPYDPALVPDSLLLGNETLDYDVYVVTVSASYRF